MSFFFFGDSLPQRLIRIVMIQLMTGHWHNGVSIKLILIIELDLVLTHRLATLLWKTLFLRVASTCVSSSLSLQFPSVI